MTYISVPKRNTAKLMSAVFFAIAAVCFMLSALEIYRRGILQILMFVSLVVSIQIMQRYVLTSYEYILDPIDDILRHNRITVVKTVGKRRSQAAFAHMKALIAVEKNAKRKELEGKYGTPISRYSFTADMFPKDFHVLVFESYEGVFFIKLQADEDFVSELSKRAGV